MPKGEHFKKYAATKKLDMVFSMRINSDMFKQFQEIVINPQEWLRAQIRSKIQTEQP